MVEILAILIRNNVHIKGYKIKGYKIKLCQLADDTTLFVLDNDSSRIALKTFEEFYRYAGLGLNKNKTVAVIMWNNGSIHKDEILNINWSQKAFKTLGIWFSLNIEEMIEINITAKLKKISSLLNMWSARYLSLKGKITVLKSLVMPHILHIASTLFISDNIVKTLDEMFFNFVWSNRKHGIAKNTLMQPIEAGGLKMICISSMIKCTKIMLCNRKLTLQCN